MLPNQQPFAGGADLPSLIANGTEQANQPRRRGRSDTYENSLPGSEAEVVSLLSSDEDVNNIKPVNKTKPQGGHARKYRRVADHGSADMPSSGRIISSPIEQPRAENPDGYAPNLDINNNSYNNNGTNGLDRSTWASGMNLNPGSSPSTRTVDTKPSLATPENLPASSNVEPLPPSQIRAPVPVKEPALCPEQAELVDIILSGRNVFYTGSAGCGKSTALKVFTQRLRERGLIVNIVAPTGISALGVGGSTTFVYAGWGIGSFKKSIEKLRAAAHAKHVKQRLKGTNVLVIDEISMVDNFHFERLNAVMQEARGSYRPFGGVQVIVTGDFHQLPPVKPFAHCLTCGEELVENRSQATYTCKSHGTFKDEDKWAFKSRAWEKCNFVYFHLKTIHRQNDETFIKILQKCRVGQPLTYDDTDTLMNHPCKIGNATKLYARREEVRTENRKRFDKLLSEKFSYPSLDSFTQQPHHPDLDRNRWREPDGSLSTLRDHRFESLVEFKKGMLVVLLTNLDLSQRLCNGSQGIICGYEDYDPAKLPKAVNKQDLTSGNIGQNTLHGDYAQMREMHVRDFITRPEVTKKVWPIVKFHNGAQRTIYAECSVHPLGNVEPYSLLSRTQIPLAPAWAMSIHKSQSLTLDRVIVDLTRAWEEGQVYVALSRATSLYGLKIEGDPRGLTVGKGGNPEVKQFHQDKFGI